MKDSKITNKFLLILMTFIMILPMNLVHATTNAIDDPEETSVVEEIDDSNEILEDTVEDAEQELEQKEETETTERTEETTEEIEEKTKEKDNANDETKESVKEEKVETEKKISKTDEEKKEIEIEDHQNEEESEENDDVEELPEEIINDIESASGPGINYVNPGPLFKKETNKSVFRKSSLANKNYNKVEAPEGLEMSKKVKPLGNGEYEVKLEAYTTGNVKKTETTVPMDVVLVLDQSGSMAYDFNGNSTTDNSRRRLTSLISSVGNFTETVKDNAVDNKVDHRIAVTGFSSSGYNNTEILTGTNITKITPPYDRSNPNYYPYGGARNGIQYGNGNSITPEQYQNALQDVSQEPGQKSVADAVNALTAHGGTQTLDGLDMAEKIFANDTKSGEERNRVVILFTDGDTNSNRADVVNKAYRLKNTHNATVYSVGIFTGADGRLRSHGSAITNTNTLMHAISSNYPNATATWDIRWGSIRYSYTSSFLNPDLENNESYYLSAGDSDGLKEIFETIGSQIGEASVDLGSETVIKDIVTPQFDIVGGAEDIKVETLDRIQQADGQYSWQEPGNVKNGLVTLSDDRTVEVSGFDFKKNFVSEIGRAENDPNAPGNFLGRKLVITFKISERDGFWGGNQVETNGHESGIYDKNDDIVGNFDIPTVDIPLSIESEITPKNYYMYLKGETPTVDELYTTTIPIKPEDEWKTAYVEIEGPKFSSDSTIISDTEDTTKGLKAFIKLKPKYPGTYTSIEKESPDSAKVYVFKPEINHKNGSVYYGESEDKIGDLNNYRDPSDSVKWTNDALDKTDKEQNMDGKEPELTYEYVYSNPSDINDGYIDTKEDIYVNVDVKIQDESINTHTKFTNPRTDFDFSEGKFLIEVKTVELKITKKGGTTGEPYVFEIRRDGEDYTEASITRTEEDSDSIIISELPVGEYTVNENTDWSWRFKTVYRPENKTDLDRNNIEEEIIVENKKQNDNWLNGFSKVLPNVFGQKKQGGNSQ